MCYIFGTTEMPFNEGVDRDFHTMGCYLTINRNGLSSDFRHGGALNAHYAMKDANL